MTPRRFRTVPEIDGELVTQEQVEYLCCIHCHEYYNSRLPIASALLTTGLIWWHLPTCPRPVYEEDKPHHPPCALGLCDGSGLWLSLYPGEPFVCFCKRP